MTEVLLERLKEKGFRLAKSQEEYYVYYNWLTAKQNPRMISQKERDKIIIASLAIRKKFKLKSGEFLIPIVENSKKREVRK